MSTNGVIGRRTCSYIDGDIGSVRIRYSSSVTMNPTSPLARLPLLALRSHELPRNDFKQQQKHTEAEDNKG
jgi:hypothetical protein